jgi:hypothetical protein
VIALHGREGGQQVGRIVAWRGVADGMEDRDENGYQTGSRKETTTARKQQQPSAS